MKPETANFILSLLTGVWKVLVLILAVGFLAAGVGVLITAYHWCGWVLVGVGLVLVRLSWGWWRE